LDDPSARGWEALRERLLPDGGFSGRPGGQYRPDATAWAAFALAARGSAADVVAAARTRLGADQLDDGRVPVRPEHPEATWPTSLAVLAWLGSPEHRKQERRAIEFLMNSSGAHWPAEPDRPFGHDPSIRGWSWVMNSHSWVEPTSIAMLALRAAGQGDHERAREGARMLLDRQLPQGGWNYGNTTVLGKGLLPFPDSTGIALAALAGRTDRQSVRASIDYLEAELARVRTPLAVGWGVLGLIAWEEASPRMTDWVHQTLSRPGGLAAYDTAQLALLLLADGVAAEPRDPFSAGGRRAK
jgi:hypothetical protein